MGIIYTLLYFFGYTVIGLVFYRMFLKLLDMDLYFPKKEIPVISTMISTTWIITVPILLVGASVFFTVKGMYKAILFLENLIVGKK